MFPEIAIPRLPFMGAYAVRVRSLAAVEALLRQERMTDAPARRGAGRAVSRRARRRRMAVRRECRRSALAKLKRARYGKCREMHIERNHHDREPQPWQDQLFDVLKRADIRQVGYVPDAGHSRLIARCKADPDIRDVVLTTEEEGIAHGRRRLARRAALGAADAIERRRQLHQHAVADPRLPLSDADAGDDARRVGGVQSLAGADGLDRRAGAEALRHRTSPRPRQPEQVVPLVQNAVQLAFGDDRAAAVLLSQKLIGRKVWVK